MLGLRSANAFKMVRLSAPFRLKHVDTNFLIWPSAGTLTRAWRRRRIGVLRGIHPVARSLRFRVLQHSSASAPSANLYQVCGVSTNGSLSSCHSLFVRGVVNKFVALVRRIVFCLFLFVTVENYTCDSLDEGCLGLRDICRSSCIYTCSNISFLTVAFL